MLPRLFDSTAGLRHMDCIDHIMSEQRSTTKTSLTTERLAYTEATSCENSQGYVGRLEQAFSS